MGHINGEMEVYQSNRLVEAAQTLTLNEKRLIIAAAALHDSRRPQPKQGTITLYADDFASVFGIESKGHIYEVLEDAVRRLGNRWIKTIYTRNGKPAERNVRWVWMVEYRKGEGAVMLGFSPGVVPYLTMLHTEFTKYKLKQVGKLGSFYSLRLYELCCQFKKTGKRIVTMERFRQMLDLGDKYKRLDNLRRRILTPAIKEINRHTDLNVRVELTRKGRKITGFSFQIKEDDSLKPGFS